MGFFDQVIAGVDRGVTTAKEGSRLVIEKSRLKTQMSDVEREKNKLLLNMGNLVFNLHASGEIQIEQCSAICNEITELNRQFDKLKNDYNALESAKTQYNSSTYSGQPVITNEVQCACGFMNKDGAKFCAKCGNALSDDI